MRLPTAVVLPLLSLLAVLAGCGRDNAAPSPGAGASAPGRGASGAAAGPPVSVSTVVAQQRDLPVLVTTTGKVTPLNSVEVRAQATAPLLRVHVKEGQFVRAGELLFTLDARADEARLAQARAQLARDEATLADSRRQLQRSRELLAQNFISQGAVDTNQATAEAQQAVVAASRAAIDAVRLSVSYARVTAPSAGRLGAIGVFPGSAVQAGTTPLVTVTQLDPISVAFSLPQRHLADALAALKDGGAPVQATSPEAAAKPLQGRLRFVDSAVDAETGTVRAKAEFANQNGALWPGAFVNVALTASTLRGAVVVPQASIIQGARGASVYVVENGKAVARAVQQLYAQGEDAAVSGVKPGERVVLDGRQNLRPGAAVVERGASGAGRGASAAARGASAGQAPARGPAGPQAPNNTAVGAPSP